MSERPKFNKISKAAFKKSLRLFKYFSGYKVLFFIGLFCLLVSSITSLFIITLLGRLVDSQQSELLQKVVDVSLFLGFLLIIQATASYFRIYIFGIVTENAIARIRQQVFGHLVRLPMHYFGKKRVGELSSRISADIATVQGALTTYIAEFIRQCITILGALAIMSFTSLRLALFMLSTLPLMAFVAVFFGRFVRRLSKKMQGQVAESATIVEETLQAIATVKAFVGEYFEISRYKEKTRNIVRTGIKNAALRGAFASLLIVFIFGSIVAIVWYGSGLVAKGIITDGDLFNFLFLSVFMAGSLSGLASTYSDIQKAIGSTENLFDILEEPLEIPTIAKPETITNKIKGKVAFDNVSFSYPGAESKTVLNQLSFTVDAGSQVALVGASGAGKTTITSLLLRLYNTDSGRIFIDDKPITSFALQNYRRQLALVPQDIVLFGGTIIDNIRYGNNNASEKEIKAAAKLANAHEFISAFPKGYQTLVGERGTKLSGGQRQRVAIARAILANPTILILDEATSALDSSSELKVQEALSELLKNRTSFIVAHRLSTIRNADLILVLDNGRIVESDTHEVLIKKENGYYKRYYDLQAGKQPILTGMG